MCSRLRLRGQKPIKDKTQQKRDLTDLLSSLYSITWLKWRKKKRRNLFFFEEIIYFIVFLLSLVFHGFLLVRRLRFRWKCLEQKKKKPSFFIGYTERRMNKFKRWSMKIGNSSCIRHKWLLKLIITQRTRTTEHISLWRNE